MATQTTLEALFGSPAAAKVLLFIENYGGAYAAQLHNIFGMSASQAQKQLDKFERGGILVSNKIGKARIYTWNPRDPALSALRELLRQTLDEGIPEQTLKKYFRQRQRPRRKGKEL